MNGSITKVQKFSIHDGPGIRTTIFFKGCPLSCVWCQNPETIKDYPEVILLRSRCTGCKKCIEICPKKCFSWAERIEYVSENCDRCGLCLEQCPVGALEWSSYTVSSDEVLKEVMKDKIFYDCSGGGVTLSGGEPLQQPEFCLDLASQAKALGVNVALDTSGCALPEAFKRILPFVDLFLYDLKFIDEDLHRKYTGRSNALILANFQELCRTEKKVVVRVPLIPGITDSPDNLSRITEYAEKCRPGIKVELIPFNKLAAEKYRMLGRECRVLQ